MEFTREMSNGRFQLEVNDWNNGVFIIYDGAQNYTSYSVEEAQTILDFLQAHMRFLQEAAQKGSKEDEL